MAQVINPVVLPRDNTLQNTAAQIVQIIQLAQERARQDKQRAEGLKERQAQNRQEFQEKLLTLDPVDQAALRRPFKNDEQLVQQRFGQTMEEFNAGFEPAADLPPEPDAQETDLETGRTVPASTAQFQPPLVGRATPSTSQLQKEATLDQTLASTAQIRESTEGMKRTAVRQEVNDALTVMGLRFVDKDGKQRQLTVDEIQKLNSGDTSVLEGKRFPTPYETEVDKFAAMLDGDITAARAFMAETMIKNPRLSQRLAIIAQQDAHRAAVLAREVATLQRDILQAKLSADPTTDSRGGLTAKSAADLAIKKGVLRRETLQGKYGANFEAIEIDVPKKEIRVPFFGFTVGGKGFNQKTFSKEKGNFGDVIDPSFLHAITDPLSEMARNGYLHLGLKPPMSVEEAGMDDLNELVAAWEEKNGVTIRSAFINLGDVDAAGNPVPREIARDQLIQHHFATDRALMLEIEAGLRGDALAVGRLTEKGIIKINKEGPLTFDSPASLQEGVDLSPAEQKIVDKIGELNLSISEFDALVEGFDNELDLGIEGQSPVDR